MMEPIEFWVAGEPKAQPRVKAYKRGAHAGVYDPGTAGEWKDRVAVAAKPYIPAEPLSGPLRVSLTFYFPRPKSHFRTGRYAHEMRPDAPSLHAKKPDRDNLEKAVTDALTVARMWQDDSQICDGPLRKRFDDGRGPGCLIRITDATEP